MSEPHGSMQLETLLQILFVVGVFAVALVYAIRSNRTATKVEMEFAQAQGWTYTLSYKDPQGLTKRLKDSLERVSPDKEFDLQTIMTVESGWRRVFLFGCRYRVLGRGRKDGPGSACLIESNRLKSVGSHVDIVWSDRVGTAPISPRVNMSDSEFARNFTVSSRDPALAKKTVNEAIQEVLLEHKKSPGSTDVWVDIGPGGAVVLKWGQASPEQWLELLDLCRRIEAEVP